MDEKALLGAIGQMMDQKLEPIKTEQVAIRSEIRDLKSIVETGFKETREELVTAIEAVGNQIDEIESVTARNCYRLEILDSKKKA